MGFSLGNTSAAAAIAAFQMTAGDGSDGNVTFDGSSVILGITPAANVYTLARDIYPANMTVNSGVSIKTVGFCIFVQDTLMNAGTIHFNGNAGGNGALSALALGGTSFSSQGTLGISGGGGGQGRLTAGTGSQGTGSGGNNVAGAAGAAGGSAGANAGGTGNSSSSPAATAGSIRDFGFPMRRRLAGNVAPSCGGGGGAGAGTVTTGNISTGAGGGAGGGVLIICWKLNNTGTISANGGNGGNGYADGDGVASGGGSGAPGWVYIAAASVTSSGTIQSISGTPGTGAGIGATSGGSATPGLVVKQFINF